MKTEEKGIKKIETDYLGPSDIVNGAGGQYVIKEEEMESALQDVFKEIDGDKKKS